jgi:plasmid stabilization system protein ParE
MMPLRVHPDAEDELREGIRYYASLPDGGELALDFQQTYLRYEASILNNPLLYNIRAGIVRRVNLTPRFGEYHIAYMLWHEKVVILAIAHAKRRPYYWRHRISESKQLF